MTSSKTKMFQEPEPEIFSTRDISLAATLVTLNFPVIAIDYQIEGTNPRQTGYFQFEPSEEVKEAAGKYWSGQLAVEPKTFMTNIRGLKAQVNGHYDSPHTRF